MKNNWPKLLLIILVALLLRLPTFLTDFVNIDENEYAIAAQKILDGGLPYKDFLIYQPPIIYYLYALAFWLSGGIHIWAAEIMTIIFVLGTIITIYMLTLAVTNSVTAALAAAAAYGVFSTTFLPQDMLAANCEILMMLPITLSVLALYFAEKKQGSFLYLLTGVFASLGFLTKYQSGVVVAAEGFYILIITAILSRSFSIRKNLIPSAVLSAGFFIPIILLALYFWSQSSISYAIEAWEYILLYAKGPVQTDPLYILIKFILKTLLFILPGIIMWIGAASIIGNRLKGICRKKAWNQVEKFLIFVILWFFVSIIPIIIGGRIYFHYYFVILPPAATLFGIWWYEKGIRLKNWLKIFVFIWLLICVAGWTTYSIRKPLRPLNTNDLWVIATNRLKEIANPKDTLFVWGYCPQLYIFSGLKNATRFTTCDYLTGRSPMTAGLEYDPNGLNPPSSLQKAINDFKGTSSVVVFDTSYNIFPKAWQYLKEDFEKALPTYIVDTSWSNYRMYGRYPVEKYPYLAKVISENYKLVESIEGYEIYRLK